MTKKPVLFLFLALFMGISQLQAQAPEEPEKVNTEETEVNHELLPGIWLIEHVFIEMGEETIEDTNLIFVVHWEIQAGGDYIIYNNGVDSEATPWKMEIGKFVTNIGIEFKYEIEVLTDEKLSVFVDQSVPGYHVGTRYVLKRVEKVPPLTDFMNRK